jgi:hypothetical protein
MDTRPIPKTMEEKIDQMWYALIGTNGEGLISIVKGNTESIAKLVTDQKIHSFVCPRSDDIVVIKNDVETLKNKPGKEAIRFLRWAGVTFGALIAAAIMFFIGQGFIRQVSIINTQTAQTSSVRP